MAAGSDVALERAVFDLMPRMSSAAKVRNAEQLLRIRHHVEKHLLSETVSDVRQLELLQSGYATGLLAPDPVHALAVDYAPWLARENAGSSPLALEAVESLPDEAILAARELGEQIHRECCA